MEIKQPPLFKVNQIIFCDLARINDFVRINKIIFDEKRLMHIYQCSNGNQCCIYAYEDWLTLIPVDNEKKQVLLNLPHYNI